MKFSRKLIPAVFAVLTLFSLTAFRPSVVAANDCGGPYPPKPDKVWAKPGPAGGEATLYWDEAAYANRYAVAYGTKSGDYVYGADNIGGKDSRSYTVGGLTPGMKYYFVISAARDCSASPFSAEVTAWAGGGVVSMVKADMAAGRVGAVSYQPAKPQTISNLSVRSGPAVGQVTLKWWHKEDADDYHLVYGTKMGQYEYGALNIGKVTEFTVGSLVPGRNYYFALVPVKGGSALYTGEAVRGIARGMPVAEVMTSPINLIQPAPIRPSEAQVQGTEDEFSDDYDDYDDYEYEESEDQMQPENSGGMPDISTEGYVGLDEGPGF